MEVSDQQPCVEQAMRHPEGVSQWIEEITSGLPVLHGAQAWVLAQWCFAMEETGGCGCTTLAVFLSLALGCTFASTRQRLREWYFDAEDKCGLNRRDGGVRLCFGPPAKWVLARWPGPRGALARDPPSPGGPVAILAVQRVL